jgi:DNA-binding LytR/AlgR family response regulator
MYLKGKRNGMPVTDINYFKADGNYTYIYFINGNKEHFTAAISEVMKSLSQDFIRCHRSYIINIHHIARITTNGNWTILMRDMTQIPVSGYKQKEFLQSLPPGFLFWY